MNLYDKAISYFNPQKAIEHQKARMKLSFFDSNYKGASRAINSLKNWFPASGDSDYIDLEDLPLLRDRSYDLYRNSDLIKGGIDTIVTSVIGDGLKVQANIDNEFLGISDENSIKWEKKAERIFNNVANSKNSDYMRMSTFFELQATVLKSMLLGGDVFATFPQTNYKNYPYKTSIKLIEAQKCLSPYNISNYDGIVADGVEINREGKLKAYHFKKAVSDLNNATNQLETVKIQAFDKDDERQVFQIFKQDRPQQRRGIPALASAIPSIKQLDKLKEAELMATVVSSLFTVFIKNTRLEEGETKGELSMGSGSIVDLYDDEEIELANPTRPNQAFEGFLKAIEKEIGSSIGLPYELFIKHFESSYTSARASMLEAWRGFKILRKLISVNFNQPFYEKVITEAILNGELEANGFFDDYNIRRAYLGSVWNGTGAGQINEKVETAAAVARVEAGFSTHEKEAMEINGTDYYSNLQKIKIENRLKKEAELIKEEVVN